MAGTPPGRTVRPVTDCPNCLGQLDQANVRAGQATHPTCTPIAAKACDVAAAGPAGPAHCGGGAPMRYEGQGRYCDSHARMMIPRSQWQARGVPEPPKAAPAAKGQARAGAEPAALDLEAEPG